MCSIAVLCKMHAGPIFSRPFEKQFMIHAEPIEATRGLMELGEGPLWVPEWERLYWLDITGKRLYWFGKGIDGLESAPLPSLVGCVALQSQGTFLLAAQEGVLEVQVHRPADRSLGADDFPERSQEGEIEILRTLAHPEQGMRGNRYNDGKLSPEGRFWFGSLNMNKEGSKAALYVMDRDKSGEVRVRTVLSGAGNSNGLGWSPDGTRFYWIDTPTRRVEAFDYDPEEGRLANRRTVVAFPEVEGFGRPDGMTVDGEGNLWIAHYAGGRVSVWDPRNGRMLEEIRLPVVRVTSLTFGGTDRRRLFITTAYQGMSESEREANDYLDGSLFVVDIP